MRELALQISGIDTIVTLSAASDAPEAALASPRQEAETGTPSA